MTDRTTFDRRSLYIVTVLYQGGTTIWSRTITKPVIPFPRCFYARMDASQSRFEIASWIHYFRSVPRNVYIFQDWSMLIRDAKLPATIADDSSLYIGRNIVLRHERGALSRRCELSFVDALKLLVFDTMASTRTIRALVVRNARSGNNCHLLSIAAHVVLHDYIAFAAG